MTKVFWSMMWILTLLVSCTSVSAPIDEFPTYPVPEPSKVNAPTLDFTLPIYIHESLHPTIVTNQTNQRLSPLLYESLYVLDENFMPQPYLVEDYEVGYEGTRWVFTLKEGIAFWDGTPLTGRIVASALNEAKGSTSCYAPRFDNITTITGNDRQVTVTLSSPNWNLPALLDIPLSFGGGTLPQGTGAYLFDQEEMCLRQQPQWWGDGSTLPQEILLFPLTNTGEFISAFDGGNLSILDADLTGSQEVSFSGNYQVWEYNSTNLFYLGFNTMDSRLTANFRRTFSEALDRDSLVTQVLAGYGTSTLYPIHPDTEVGGLLESWSYDAINSGNQFLSYGRLPTGLTLLVNSENTQKLLLAQEIAEHISTFSLSLEVVAVPWSEYLLALEEGNFDLYLGELYLTGDFDVSALLSSQGMYNYGMYANHITDGLWNRYRQYGLEALEDEGNFFTYFREEMPIAPLFFKSGTALSLWGHLAYANPTAQDLFYDLSQWEIVPAVPLAPTEEESPSEKDI